MVVEGEQLELRQVGGRGLLGLLEVVEDRRRRPHRGGPPPETQAVQGDHAEVLTQTLLGLPEGEGAGWADGHRRAPRPQARQDGVGQREGRRNEHLGGTAQPHRLRQTLDVDGLPDPEVGGGHVDERDAQAVPGVDQGGQEIVDARVEEPRLRHRARRDEAHDLPAEQLPALGGRAFDLVADRDLEPGPDEPRDVGLDGVVRDPRHRNRSIALLAGGERDAEESRRGCGVLVKGLVEVTEPEEEEIVRIASLPLPILAHHGRDVGARDRRAGLRRAGRLRGLERLAGRGKRSAAPALHHQVAK